MKHWDKHENHYTLKDNDRVLSFGVSGGYIENGFWIEEGCDNHYWSEYTKQQAIEMLQEAIDIIKESTNERS